jgi:DNA-binding CsgD family transcriptional regulator
VSTLDWTRARALIRLFGEAREHADDAAARHDHILTGLGRLFDAQLCASVVDADFHRAGRGQIVEIRELGWGNDSDRQRFVDVHMERGAAVHPCVASLMTRSASLPAAEVMTALRSDLVEDRDWYRTPFVQDCMRPCRYDDVLLSVRATGVPHQIQGLAFHRAWGAGHFSDTDRLLLELFHREGYRLLERWTRSGDHAISESLTPRQRDTLECLLSGASEKETARRLGLSPHTVHVHVKALYRAFEVRTRAELLARFSGRRGARPRRRLP